MPIVVMEVVVPEHEVLPAALAPRAAAALGRLFGSAPGGTWVRVHELRQDRYAENDSKAPAPLFVSVLHKELPSSLARAEQAKAIAREVAALTGRPMENVHVIFEAAGRGRVAFGGELMV